MTDNITVLGVGNILYQDDGVGIRVVEALSQKYDFSDNVTIVDGGVLRNLLHECLGLVIYVSCFSYLTTCKYEQVT